MTPALARKAIAAGVYIFLMLMLQRFGMSAEDLTTYGVSIGEVQEFVVAVILAIGGAVLTYYQPNELWDSIVNYWRPIAIWTAALAVVAILAWWWL